MARLKAPAILLLLLVTAAWVINQYIIVKTQARIFQKASEVPEVEVVIVPGASVYRSGKLSPVLRQRMEGAVAYIGAHQGVKLILSGHSIQGGYNETVAMVDFARRHSVPAKDIHVDEKGRSTYVTLLNCRRRHPQYLRVLVVSQDYHLPRALYIAEEMGMEASGLVVAGEYPAPSRFHVREHASRFKDFFLLRVSKYFHAD